MPVLGAHVDSSGGLHLAFERAKAMGAEAIQVHPTPPGFWGSPKLDENRIAAFKEAAAKHSHPPFYFHAVYLINLAGDDPTLRQRSESTLAGYLKAADELGVNGVIFHTGLHKGAGFDARLPSITEHLQHVLERANPKSARLLIENNAGLGGCVGARFEEIAQMLSALDNDPRVGVCFDTCHAFASGYDERTVADVEKTVDELDRAVGLSRVEVIHCNDSLTQQLSQTQGGRTQSRAVHSGVLSLHLDVLQPFPHHVFIGERVHVLTSVTAQMLTSVSITDVAAFVVMGRLGLDG